jgi:hypothetical protein
LTLSFFRFFILIYSTHTSPVPPYGHKPLADSDSPPERALSKEPSHNASLQRELIQGEDHNNISRNFINTLKSPSLLY